MTNDRSLAPAQVLQAHKGEPMIEKRFEQLKTVHEIAPVLLKDEGRIEVLFTLYFLALLVQALIERELRLAMHRAHIAELPRYPEQRQCARPTAEQILRLFTLAERHRLVSADEAGGPLCNNLFRQGGFGLMDREGRSLTGIYAILA